MSKLVIEIQKLRRCLLGAQGRCTFVVVRPSDSMDLSIPDWL